MNWTSAVLVLTFCTVGFLSVLGWLIDITELE